MSETTYAELPAGLEARLASGEFQLVSGQKHDYGRQLITADTIRAGKCGYWISPYIGGWLKTYFRFAEATAIVNAVAASGWTL
jgi:hypothetical protein